MKRRTGTNGYGILKKLIERVFMISQSTIEAVTRLLVTVYNPLEIYLFGSYAWGTPTEDSDLDLLVVVEKSDERKHKRSIPAYQALLKFDVPKDIIIYTQEEFKQRIADVTTLCYKIKKEARQIYAKS
jgi:predicted nucleotidyltransferase